MTPGLSIPFRLICGEVINPVAPLAPVENLNADDENDDLPF